MGRWSRSSFVTGLFGFCRCIDPHISWCPPRSHTSLHTHILASPSQRAVFSLNLSLNLLEGRAHSSALDLLACHGSTSPFCLCLSLRLAPIRCFSGHSWCPSPRHFQRNRLHGHIVWVKHIYFTAAPAGSPPGPGPPCTRHCAQAGGPCQDKSEGEQRGQTRGAAGPNMGAGARVGVCGQQ